MGQAKLRTRIYRSLITKSSAFSICDFKDLELRRNRLPLPEHSPYPVVRDDHHMSLNEPALLFNFCTILTEAPAITEL